MIDMAALADAFWYLIDQGKHAEALVALHHHHKKSVTFWYSLKSELLHSAKNSRDILVVASLLDCSTKDTLTESCHLVPGLSAFIHGES